MARAPFNRVGDIIDLTCLSCTRHSRSAGTNIQATFWGMTTAPDTPRALSGVCPNVLCSVQCAMAARHWTPSAASNTGGVGTHADSYVKEMRQNRVRCSWSNVVTSKEPSAIGSAQASHDNRQGRLLTKETLYCFKRPVPLSALKREEQRWFMSSRHDHRRAPSPVSLCNVYEW